LAIQLEKHHPIAQFIGLGFVEVFHHDVFAFGQLNDDFLHGFHAEEKDLGRQPLISILSEHKETKLPGADIAVFLYEKPKEALGTEHTRKTNDLGPIFGSNPHRQNRIG
jgi:hypothetical protein